jgi:alginate O-acetyltransferase complex protein AlgJ
MRAALVIAFLLVITLPGAANLAGHDGADPHAENRELAAFPRLHGATMPSLRAYSDQFSAWFDDHFAFRSTLVRWSGVIRLLVLGVSPSRSVAKGEDGWFFYADDDAIEDYANVTPFTPEAVANWRTALVRANGWLHSRHVTYVFTIAPDKHVLYPEEMPSSVSRVGDLSRTDQLLTALQDTGFAVDLRPALVESRSGERIYQRTDTHWNDRGAFAAYRQIIRAVRARAPAVPPEWRRDDFEAASREVEGGDLAGMMGLKRVLREEDLPLVPRRPRRAVVIEPQGAAPTAEEGYLVTEIPGSTLPRAVIFRDSFVSQLVPFLSEHFSRAVYMWQNDFDADLVSREKPDVVIQEIVGRHLYGFIPSPELVPQR